MLSTMMGHEVHTAYDGEDAIAAIEKFKPEVILLDIGMPKLNGYDVCRHIRQEQLSNGAFVALTGWGQEHDHAR
jgi:CheY-like chemotaxis protein